MKRLQAIKKATQRGVGMLEYGVVAIIAAIVLIGIYLAFNTYLTNSSVDDNVKDLTYIAGQLQQKFGAQNNYANVTTATAVTSHAIPDYLRVSGTSTAQNKFSGAITVAPATLTTANDAAAVTWSNIPSDRCADIVTGADKAFKRIAIGGTVVKPLNGTLNQATLGTQCEAASNVNGTFTVGRN